MQTETYYWQEEPTFTAKGRSFPGRELIDSQLRTGWKLLDTTAATSWLAAKKQFGLPLTVTQAYQLQQQRGA